MIVIYIFYKPVYYDHAAIVAVTVIDGAIIAVAIVNPVPVAAIAIVACAKQQRIIARAAIHEIKRVICAILLPRQGVVACTAIDGVAARAAVQQVIAKTAIQRVVICAACKRIVAIAANEAIGATATMQGVIAFAAPLEESEPNVLAIYLEAGDPLSRLDGAELQISLKLVSGLSQDEVQALVSRLAETWSQSEVIAESVDSMQLRLLAAE